MASEEAEEEVVVAAEDVVVLQEEASEVVQEGVGQVVADLVTEGKGAEDASAAETLKEEVMVMEEVVEDHVDSTVEADTDLDHQMQGQDVNNFRLV